MDVRQLIVDHGLEAIADDLLAAVRPAVHLILGQPGQGQVGLSRIGGRPDLPTSMSWPTTADGEAYRFLLQINLDDIPQSTALPRHGMLYAFVGLDQPAWDVDSRVVLYAGSEPLRESPDPEVPFANDEYGDIPPHRLHLEVRPDVPHWATSDHEALVDALPDGGDAAYEGLEWALQAVEGSRVGQLLGHVSGVGDDPRCDAFIVRAVNPEWLHDYDRRRELDMAAAVKWTNLLRIDSCRALDLCIWDAGFLNFLIHEDDLARGDTGRIYTCVETS